MNGINEKSMVDGEEQGGRVGELCSRSEPPVTAESFPSGLWAVPETVKGSNRKGGAATGIESNAPSTWW